MKLILKLILLTSFFSFFLVGCTDNNGVDIEDSTWNNSTTVDGQVATLTIDATKKFLGNAVVRITVNNTTATNLQPALSRNNYCYKFTVLNSRNEVVKIITFGLDDFRQDFDSDLLLPGRAYTNYDYVFFTDLFNLTSGKVKAEVWLIKENDTNIIYHIYGEVPLEDLLKQLGKK